MKNRLIKIGIMSLGLGTVVLGTGCKKFLDENPDRRTEINTVEKLGQLLVTAYPDRNYYTFAETASDNAEDKSAALAGHNNEPFVSIYNWNVAEGTGNGTPTEYWEACYEAIAAANQALKSIEENNFGPAANQYKGEALVARAYAEFMLVTFFSDPYEIGGTNGGLGVPYPLEPESVTRPTYERGTVASTYAQIKKDLEEGLPLLVGAKYQVPHYHFTEQAAKAFATRFYLFAGDWDNVISNANTIYTDGNFKANIRQYTGELYSLSFTEHRVEYTKAEKTWNLLLATTYSVFQRGSGAGQARYSFGETVKTYFGANTVFGAPFRNRLSNFGGAPNYGTNKFNEYFYYTNVQAGTGQPYIMAPILTADEALLNRAEAYIHKAKKDNMPALYDAAIKDLNDFASTRIVNYNATTHGLTIAKAKDYFGIPTATDDEALLQALLQTKRIAFMQEGIRWFDILRHKLPVKHNFIAADGTETFQTLEPGDKRRTFQIPQAAIDAGITPNPR
jgi:hypothetical protein